MRGGVMRTRDMIDELFRAMEWSDARMWMGARKTPGALDDPRVCELIHHLHIVQRSFLSVWRGKPERPPSLDSFPDMLTLELWARSYYAEANAFIASLDDEALDRPVVLPWAERIAQVAGGSPEAPTLAETLVQVAMHTAHHRAQVSSRVRELGGEPMLLDFIVWVWQRKPAPQWT
jgi:uncharacterized damage-inducible protein DinB